MALDYAENVVGGIDHPRFLLVGPELGPNQSFEDGLTGVAGSSGATAQELDVTTPFGDYALTVEDDAAGSQEYGEITVNTGAAIAQKRFITLAYARNDVDDEDGFAWTIYQGLSGDHEKQLTVGPVWWQEIVHEVVVPAGAAGNNLVYRIYPFAKGAGNAGEGKLRIDNFRCRQIIEEIELPLPMRGRQKQMWRKEFWARHQLISGAQKSYKKGMRYYYESTYERLTAAQEVLRSKLINTDYEILFFPHKDSPMCYFVEWDNDYERTWAFGVAAWGHEGNIALVGTELLPALPDLVIDELTEYTYESDEMYFETLDDSFVYTS